MQGRKTGVTSLTCKVPFYLFHSSLVKFHAPFMVYMHCLPKEVRRKEEKRARGVGDGGEMEGEG